MSKLSLHCQRIEPWVNATLADLGAQWAKIVNPGPGADPLPAVPHKIVRIWTDDMDGRYIGQGEAGGRQFVRDMLPRWRGTPWAACYELANEPACNDGNSLALLNAYTLGAMHEADAQGIKLCILNLPEGNPGADEGLKDEAARISERWKLAQLAPAVKYAATQGHYLGLHAYWRPEVEGPDGRWHALGRVVWNVEQWASMGVDLSRLKVLVNECGLDGGIAGHKETQYKSWRTLLHGDRARYAAELVQAEEFARRYPWLQTILLFVAGYEDPWADFDADEDLARRTIAPIRALPAQPAPPSPEPPKPANKLVIDGRCMTIEQFAAFVAELKVTEPYDQVVIHHTAIPTEATWKGAKTIEAMRKHYEGVRKWSKGPHLFIGPEGIWLFWDLRRDGYGVANGNKGRRHIEIVGDYTDHLPSGAILDNAVAAAAILLGKIGRGVESLSYHRLHQLDTDCPGDALVDRWPWLKSLVAAAMQPEPLPEHEPATDPATMAEKARYWAEEMQRQEEAGNREWAKEIRLSLIKLLYKLESTLKQA